VVVFVLGGSHGERRPDNMGVVGDTQVFELRDGRELAWMEYGMPDGVPVMAFHGSPGTRYLFAPDADAAARKGVRLIAPDRPGYGHSTYHAARSYQSWAGDVTQLADHLGLDRFSVLGTSSGGPNAAGCAYFLADRLDGCAIVSGPAPPEHHVATKEMAFANRLARRVAPVAPGLMSVVWMAGLRRVARSPERAFALMNHMLPDCDVAVVERPELRTAMLDDLARPLSPTAARAATQDFVLELKSWGFQLRDIAMHVHVWHGDLDRNVVVDCGIYQAAQIPNATLHRLPDSGHWYFHERFGEILDTVTR
jgi:pimeloyl-ACP methyl ester carboxylesterase